MDTERFTLYLKGGDKGKLLSVLRKFGSPGDADTYTIESCGAEVVLGAEVALIKVPLDSHELAVRDLINDLHRDARAAGLSLSDDVASSRSAEDLWASFHREREQAGIRSSEPTAGGGAATNGRMIAIGALVIVALILLYFMYQQLAAGAAHVAKGWE